MPWRKFSRAEVAVMMGEVRGDKAGQSCGPKLELKRSEK